MRRSPINYILPCAGPPADPSIGVAVFVQEHWGDVWTARHQITTRLAKEFKVVWIQPAPHWRSVMKLDSGLLPEVNHSELLPGFMLLSSPGWLPRLYRPEWLNRYLFRQRVLFAQRVLRKTGCRKLVAYLWRPEFGLAFDCRGFDMFCYHIDDEYSFADSTQPIDDKEMRVIKRADRVFIHSSGLMERKGHINEHTDLVPNGVDYQAFATPNSEPSDLAGIGHPRIGYTGILKRTLDWPLICHLAEERKQYNFVFVGEIRQNQPEIHPFIERLHRLDNVYLIGHRPAYQLPGYAQHFDVSIMPYAGNTHSVDFGYPLKLHEFLATGRPTIGTSKLRTLREFADVIAIATTREEWLKSIDHAISGDASRPADIKKRQAVAERHDWQRSVDTVAGAIRRHLDSEVE